MKVISIFFWLAFSCIAFAQEKAPIGAWMPTNVRWQNAPADVEPNLSTASTRILYFQPDGKMSVIGCIVYRRSGHYALGADGETIALGQWRKEHGHVFARSRLTYRSIEKIGENLPGPWIDEVLTPKDQNLLLNGVIYRRVPDLTQSAAELMPQPIRFFSK